MNYDLEMIEAEIKLLYKENQLTKYGYDSLKFLIKKNIEQSSITAVGNRRKQVYEYCGGSGWDSYPNHDTTPKPCPECQP